MADTILAVRGLTKRFGGLVANDTIDLDVQDGDIHAIIGPNGAGKTTLIALLAGELTPDSGSIRFNGRDITALPVHARSGLGLARSFQISSVFRSFSTLENGAIAAQAHHGHSFRFWEPAHLVSGLNAIARSALARVGLGEREVVIAASLSHGEHRELEIAMALATGPRLLLLDEPAAGMGTEESERLARLLREIRADYTIVLVEHDMDIVFALADRITVLANGRVIASGLPASIRGDARVREAYLGET